MNKNAPAGLKNLAHFTNNNYSKFQSSKVQNPAQPAKAPITNKIQSASTPNLAFPTNQNQPATQSIPTPSHALPTNQNQASHQPNSPANPALLTDKNLYLLCKTYGSRALEWRRKFTGLLPEVNRRRLFEKKGFPSIFVFAKKLAGLSEEQVRLTLNLEKKFEAVPLLKNLLTNGEVSINKLARVASVATEENQEFLAEHLKVLSKSAVETLVRDEKICINQEMANKNANGLLQPQGETKSLPGQTFVQSNPEKSTHSKLQTFQSLHLSPAVHQKLLELQQKGLDLNQLLLEFLQKRETEIFQKKEEISRKVLQRETQKNKKSEEVSEYILKNPLKTYRPSLPMPVKKILKEEYGTKCAIKSCQKQAENIHHTLPFYISKSHDPKFLMPLCKEHHELQHAVNWQFQKSRAKVLEQTPAHT